MIFAVGYSQAHQIVDQYTEQHQEHIDRFAPSIEDEGETYQYQVLCLIRPVFLSGLPFSVYPCCQQIAQQEGWQENEEEK